MKTHIVPRLMIVTLLGGPQLLQAAPGQPLSPPAKPAIAPLISRVYPNDTNADRVDDRLAERAAKALALSKSAATSEEAAGDSAQLNEMVNVELIFKEPVTQKQIDNFLALGGEITYIYRAVSYGWNGRIPLNKIQIVPVAMGATLVLIEEPNEMSGTMDEATANTRVRAVWSSGFAGNTSGFSGNTNITIAFLDSGIDDTHTDLTGRGVYWANFTDEIANTPADLDGHGSLVAGIALGSGASAGVSGALLFTEFGDNYLYGTNILGANQGYVLPMHLPINSATMTITATWLGGANTTLGRYSRANGVTSGWSVGQSTTGPSPLTIAQTAVFNSSRAFSPSLLSVGGPGVSNYVITASVSNYPAIDSFNRMRGVAPGCNWAMAKVGRADNAGLVSWASAAIDDLVAQRVEKNVKVINISRTVIGSPGINASHRQKVNSAVNNGVLVVTGTGNDGRALTANEREIDDPGRASLALTLGAANDVNQLTDYAGHGFSSPSTVSGQEEDFKPDLIAPGGSSYYSGIMSVDANTTDGPAFADQRANDYTTARGASLSTAFASGCAALVIEALEHSGVQWDFFSSQHARRVKMLLCATASESNQPREVNFGYDPTLERASAGPNGYPVGKDPYEGYGFINPDAAVEAVSLTFTNGTTNSAGLGSALTERRVWARSVNLNAGELFVANLSVPATGDLDLYLYSADPSSNGTPVMIASSTEATVGTNESLYHFSAAGEHALLVVKRVSGSGTFQISSTSIAVPPPVILPGPSDPNEITFAFDTVSNVNYAIEFKDSLDDPMWQTLQSIPGDGSSKSVTNSISTIPQRFFRLRLE